MQAEATKPVQFGRKSLGCPAAISGLAELRYGGMVAMEFLPSGDSVRQLRTARDLALQTGA